jgi:serine/threonine protein kinase
MNIENCNEWAEQRNSLQPKNPLTKRVIRKDGPIYKKLNKDCEGFIVDINSICQKWLQRKDIEVNQKEEQSSGVMNQTTDICDEWVEQRQNPSPKNPYTNRIIKKKGPKYKLLDKECEDYITGKGKPQPIHKLPPWLTTKPSGKDNQTSRQKQPIQTVPPWLTTKPSGKDNQTSRQKQPIQTMPPWLTTKPSGKDKQQIQPPGKDKQQIQPPGKDKQQIQDRLPPARENFYTTEIRVDEGEYIKKYFSDVVVEEGKVCVSESKTLLKYVVNSQKLGKGSFGNVYKASIPNMNPTLSIAIKEGRISPSEYKKALIKQYPMEYLYNKLINDLIDNKICPNFTFTYAIFFCNKCSLELNSKSLVTQCSETIVELFNTTIDKLGEILLNDKIMESILFQIFFALACIQLKYGLFHNDIKQENILIKVITKGGYWEYTLDNQTYYIPNYGYIVALNDFGVSLSYKPGISKADYGRRQAEVIKDSTTGNYFFKPFTTLVFPSLSKEANGKPIPIKPYKIVGNEGLTWNNFYKNFDSKSSIPVDLEDFGRFPVHYFNYDIIDIVSMFLGGKQALQPGHHAGLTKRTYFVNLLKDFYKVSINYKWPINGVYLFLASHAIKKIFSFYINKTLDGPKIETYIL